MSDSKICPQCGNEFFRVPKRGFKLWESQTYCSKRCAGSALNPKRPASEFRSRYRKVKTPDGRHMLEHRWVMEQVLGRALGREEQVHHKNHRLDRLDNRPENLEVVTSAEHGQRHTIHPTSKPCVICGQVFTPHKTKRVRAQTCSRACHLALLSLRNAERKSA